MIPSLAEIARMLHGEVHGDEVLCPGPDHSAEDRSLSVKLGGNGRDPFIVHSFAGDNWRACRDHVYELTGIERPQAQEPRRTRQRVVAEYIYRDEHGDPYLRVQRTDKKDFWQSHWTGSEWARGKPKGPKVPYRLPQLRAADAAAPIFICEGEKDADRLAGLGFIATTASEGAGKWTADLNKWFAHRTVFILADNDERGAAHAREVLRNLTGVAAEVRAVRLPGLPPKGDVSDWLDQGGDPTTLIDLCRAPAADGAALLDEVYSYLGRFVAYPSEHAHIAHTLWVAHAHAMQEWESTPRLAFLSPEPASGKTRALEVTANLVPSPVEAVNVTPAYLFRRVGAEDKPTILFDEIDTVFGPRAKRDNEEVRGLLNAGHRKGAVAGRCVVKGKIVETEEIEAYCAVAMAGLGDLPDTLMSRAVVIRMRRRAPGETVEPYRRRPHSKQGEELRDRFAAWAIGIDGSMIPAMPEGITDRNADVWEALLAIADAAGGEWPKRGRVAAVALVALSQGEPPSMGVRLLADLRTVFGDEDALSTGALLTALHNLDDAPWGDIKGKPLDSRGLAARLRKYDVKPKVVRIGNSTPRGYLRADLLDPWNRYLPPSPIGNATSATSATEEAADDEADPVEPSYCDDT